jgi:hypothetical protein
MPSGGSGSYRETLDVIVVETAVTGGLADLAAADLERIVVKCRKPQASQMTGDDVGAWRNVAKGTCAMQTTEQEVRNRPLGVWRDIDFTVLALASMSPPTWQATGSPDPVASDPETIVAVFTADGTYTAALEECGPRGSAVIGAHQSEAVESRESRVREREYVGRFPELSE